jgi:hypothetical protein
MQNCKTSWGSIALDIRNITFYLETQNSKSRQLQWQMKIQRIIGIE